MKAKLGSLSRPWNEKRPPEQILKKLQKFRTGKFIWPFLQLPPPQEMGTHYLPKKSTTFWAALTDVKLYLLLR